MQTSRALWIGAALAGLALVEGHAQDWRRLEKEKRYDEALAALEALAAAHSDQQAQFLRSAADLALQRLKNPEAALRYAEQVSDKAWSGFLRFSILADTGRDEEALALAAETPPDAFPPTVQTEAFLKLGNLHRKHGDTERALEAYHRATEAPGGSILHWSWACKYAADLHRARAETERELECYRLCLSKPVFLASRNECLFAYTGHLATAGQFAEAFALLDAEQARFENRDPDYWTARFWIHYANLLNLSGDRVQAIDLYDHAERRGANEAQRQAIGKARQAILDTLVSEL